MVGSTLIAHDTILSGRPADGLRPDELPAPESDIEVRVTVTVTEEILYEDTRTLTVPAFAARDDAALLAHLSEHWPDVTDVIESGVGTVNDQALTGARLLNTEATS